MKMNYALVTPARNEAAFIELTIKSVIAQTVLPLKWVIVSDGSTDGTNEIVEKYLPGRPWIELIKLAERPQRNFAAKVAAFNVGYAKLAGLDYEVIGNLDADVSFEPDYLAYLLNKFADYPELGVAGTPYREENAMYDDRFKSPDHVSGACQLFRRACFEAIGGYPLIKSGGIDFIAVLKAQATGWKTRRFEDKFCWHHKSVGSGSHASVWRRLLNHGRKDYLLGGHPTFELFRTAFQMKRKPYVVGGMLMLAGYMWAMLCRVERTMPSELIAIRQKDQMQRLKDVLRHPLKHSSGLIPAAARSGDSKN